MWFQNISRLIFAWKWFHWKKSGLSRPISIWVCVLCSIAKIEWSIRGNLGLSEAKTAATAAAKSNRDLIICVKSRLLLITIAATSVSCKTDFVVYWYASLGPNWHTCNSNQCWQNAYKIRQIAVKRNTKLTNFFLAPFKMEKNSSTFRLKLMTRCDQVVTIDEMFAVKLRTKSEHTK